MSEEKRRGGPIETRRVSDEELDRTIASLVGSAAPDVRARVVRRIAEPAGRRGGDRAARDTGVRLPESRPVVVWQAALAAAALIVLGASLWLVKAPTPSAPGKAPSAAGGSREARQMGARPAPVQDGGQIANAQSPATDVHGRAIGAATGVRRGARTSAASILTGRPGNGNTTTVGVDLVDVLPDVPPLELTAIGVQPLVIPPVVVDPIEIPDLTVPPPAEDPGDVKRPNQSTGEPR